MRDENEDEILITIRISENGDVYYIEFCYLFD